MGARAGDRDPTDGHLPDRPAAERRYGGGHLPRRSLRSCRADPLGQRLVRRPLPPRLLGVCPCTGSIRGRAAAAGALHDRRGWAVRCDRAARLRHRGSTCRRRVVRARRLGDDALRARGVQPRARGGAARGGGTATPALRGGARARVAHQPRKPRGRSLPRAGRCRLRPRRQPAARARHRRRSNGSDRGVCARLPRRRI